MIENRQVLVHLHTDVVKVPSADIIELGEIAVQHDNSEAALYIKKNNGEIAKFIDVAGIEAKLSANFADYATSADTVAAIESVDGKFTDYATSADTVAAIESVDGKFTDYATSADTVAAIAVEATRAEGIENELSNRISLLESISGESHTHTNKDVLDGISAEKVAAWDAAEVNAQAAASAYTDAEIAKLSEVYDVKGAADSALTEAKAYADGLNEAMDLRVDALEAISGESHTHANKELLDTYTQTEENLADAVAKKHEHANASELNKIADGDKAKWDDAVSRLDNFLIGTGAADVVDTLQDIKTWMDGEGVVATELTEAIAGEATLRKNADDALSGRVDALEAISGESHTHANKGVLDGISAEKVAAWDAAEANAKADAADKYQVKGDYEAAGAAAQALADAKADAADKYQVKGDYETAGAAAAVKTWVEEQNYLTQHQDISNLATKTEVADAITSANTYTDNAISKLRIDCGTF